MTNGQTSRGDKLLGGIQRLLNVMAAFLVGALLLVVAVVANCVHRDRVRDDLLDEFAHSIEQRSGAAWQGLPSYAQQRMIEGKCRFQGSSKGKFLYFDCADKSRITVELSCPYNDIDLLGSQDCPDPHIDFP